MRKSVTIPYESCVPEAVPCGPYTRAIATARDALAARNEAQDEMAAKILDLLIDASSEYTCSLLVRILRRESQS